MASLSDPRTTMISSMRLEQIFFSKKVMAGDSLIVARALGDPKRELNPAARMMHEIMSTL